MQISGIKNVSGNFNGITHVLKNHYIVSDIKNLQDSYADEASKNIVGSAPADFYKDVPKNDRRSLLKNFYKTLGKMVIDLRKSRFSEDKISEISVFLKESIGAESVKYLAHGATGTVYLINFNQNNKEKKYVLKIDKLPEYKSVYPYGNLSESVIGIYSGKNFGKKNPLVKLHYADLNARYAIYDYVDKNNKAVINSDGLLESNGFTYLDGHEDNIISGKIIDLGGIIKTNSLSESKAGKNLVKQIKALPPAERFKKWEEIFMKNEESLKPNQEEMVALATSIMFLSDDVQCFNALDSMSNYISNMQDNFEKRELARTVAGMMTVIAGRSYLINCSINRYSDIYQDLDDNAINSMIKVVKYFMLKRSFRKF